jgi:nitroreductase
VKTFFKTKSYKKALFLWHEINLNVSTLDDDMLLSQVGYFGHHIEKALKHHNRINRGKQRRDKLELIIKEIEKRNINEKQVINWAKKLIQYFDTNKEIYLSPLLEKDVKEHKSKDIILDFIKDRTTTRFWLPIEVDDKIISNILETSMSSAISCNRQTVRFAVVKNNINNMVIGDSNNKSMFKKAPVIIYIADDKRFFSEKYGNALNVGGICSLIQLAASAYGLSGSWMYHSESYEQKNLKKELGFENYMYIYSSVTIGYPADKQEKPPRFNINRFLV